MSFIICELVSSPEKPADSVTTSQAGSSIKPVLEVFTVCSDPSNPQLATAVVLAFGDDWLRLGLGLAFATAATVLTARDDWLRFRLPFATAATVLTARDDRLRLRLPFATTATVLASGDDRISFHLHGFNNASSG